MKISQLPLDDLYARKITTSVEAAIQAKDDFSKVNSRYCDTVCKMKCKAYEHVNILQVPVDVLIVQDHAAPAGKYDKVSGQQERIQKNIIDFICREAGYAGLTYRIVNLLKCAPNEQDFIRGKSPTSTILSKCKPYLFQDIANSKPKVILSLSTAVTKVLGLKSHSNTGNRGEIVDSKYGKVVLAVHPRILSMLRQNSVGSMWSADYTGVIIRDFEKAAMLARGILNPPTLAEAVEEVKKRITIARSLGDVKGILHTINSLPESRVVSFDTETTGLDGMDKDAKLLCIQFGWRDFVTNEIVAAVVPLWHRENKDYDPAQAWDLITPLLVGPRGKVAHNGKFDILYIYYTTGVRVKNLKFDTLLLMHSLSSGIQGCYSLKTAVTDLMPHSGLSGYENLLPKLTKRKTAEDTETTETTEESVVIDVE